MIDITRYCTGFILSMFFVKIKYLQNYIIIQKKLVYITTFEKKHHLSETKVDTVEAEEQQISDDVALANAGLCKAVDAYRKLIETKELTEQEQKDLEQKIKSIQDRDVIEANIKHVPTEIPAEKGSITIGPPVLTRFEQARVMGARALQLSQGAPPFIEIPKNARTSLDIAMEELEQRIIPIVIKRVLPNGDYQNIPIDYFK